MKCELAQEYIALIVYGELPDDQVHLLEQHLTDCEKCRLELEAVQALYKAMSLLPVEEPSANLVARTRLRLEEALDSMPHGSWLLRFSQRFSQGMGHLRAAPLVASALLVVGVGMGGYAGYRQGVRVHDAQQTRLILNSIQKGDNGTPQIANVSSIVQDPNSNNVEVSYNRLVPESIHGSLSDPQIRQLLILGAQNRLNSGVRDDSVGLLADECRGGQCSDGPIRNALMVALRYDRSANVRLKALEGLQPYIGDDMRVRDAILEALMKDKDSTVRAQAISLLEPVEADSSVRQVLNTVALQDDNPQIRTVSRQVLDQSPQVQ
jgi:hypothetical protein